MRALWFAQRRVCMRVCKHGCDVKMFCFCRANQVSTNLKKFLSSKLNKVTLFTHSFVGWHLENLYKEAVSIFFAKADILSEKNPYFWKASFCKTRTDYACKTSCKTLGLVRISVLIGSLTKSFWEFFSAKLFYKSNRKLFSCVCIVWYKHSRGWENPRQLCKPSTSSRVSINVSNSPNPSRVYIRLCKHGKRFLLLNCNFFSLLAFAYLN